MKNPKEYLGKYKEEGVFTHDVNKQVVLKAIKQAQKDAYNEALEDAVRNVAIKIDNTFPDTGELYPCEIDEQSILKLKK